MIPIIAAIVSQGIGVIATFLILVRRIVAVGDRWRTIYGFYG
jgi:hypothetical protein